MAESSTVSRDEKRSGAPPVDAGDDPLYNRRILVVDDELALRKGLAARFEEEGAEVDTADRVAAARSLLAEHDYDLIVLDHRLPDGTGLGLFEELRDAGNGAEVVMMTAYATPQDAVRAMKNGARDYVMKPFDLDEMVVVAQRALEFRRLSAEVDRLRARSGGGPEEIIGSSPQTAALREYLQRVASSGATTVLITGESGTGKDLVARALHRASPVGSRPFLNITCTALPESLLESELFGHEKGAFTDAKKAKRGLFEEAHGGTVFLDEIGDMPLSLQAKLLRFLESKTFRRVGGLREIRVDVRVIAATNRDLRKAIDAGEFRSDLYYRLNVIPIEIPPLRERPEDIGELLAHFARCYAEELRRSARYFDQEAVSLLTRYAWPGNVRELRNCVERAVLLSKNETLGVSDLTREITGALTPRAPVAPPMAGTAAGTVVVPQEAPPRPDLLPSGKPRILLPAEGTVFDEMAADLLDQALQRAGGNKSRAAEFLGIHRDQVRYWVKKYDLRQWIRTRAKRETTPEPE